MRTSNLVMFLNLQNIFPLIATTLVIFFSCYIIFYSREREREREILG
jgi:hypothetical protein